MEKDQLSRKLAVILHADVVGSTSLVQIDEALAHQRIQAAFNSFSDTIETYGGVAREIRGDAIVAEFDRASDAVAAAIAFQDSNRAQNQAFTDEIRPDVRIGISLGEVIVADRTITGAGVVIAQRLEQMSDLPLWAAPDGPYAGVWQVNSEKAALAGLRHRSLQQSILDTHRWFQSQPAARREKLRTGLSAEREAEVLAAWRASENS